MRHPPTREELIDFLLTPMGDRAAAETFLRKAIRSQGLPEKIPIDQSGSNMAGIMIRQCKYLNNLVEQDHRAVKRLVRPMLGV